MEDQNTEKKAKISSATAAEYGRKGGSRNSPAQRRQREAARERANYLAQRNAYELAGRARARVLQEGWSMAKFARFYGVSPSTVSRWLNHPPQEPQEPIRWG